jgi:hypothetical protein
MTSFRRLIRYGATPTALLGQLNERAVLGCRFELLRSGGCGRGELRLRDSFLERASIPLGTWIACDVRDDERWYLGRVVERTAASPAGVTLQLEGIGQLLSQLYPGGLGLSGDEPPRRYARSDWFPNDPDHAREAVDLVDRPEDVVRLLMQQYVAPQSSIQLVPDLIENAPFEPDAWSLKFNGEESIEEILRDLSLRSNGAAWGVDERLRFYFLQPRSVAQASYQEGVDLCSLEERLSEDLVFNQLLLTGGYLYESQSGVATSAVRWRGQYRQPESIRRFGARRWSAWVPWIRTAEDSRAFAREFFRRYASPQPSLTVQLGRATVCPRPWLGPVTIRDRQGQPVATAAIDRVQVQFDRGPALTLDLGVPHPSELWPQPRHQERYPLHIGPGPVGDNGPGGDISNSDESTSGSDSGDDWVTAVCGHCGDRVPRRWSFALEGLSTGPLDTCAACADLNRLFELTFVNAVGEICSWQATHAACPGAGQNRIELTLAHDEMVLQFTRGTVVCALYRLSGPGLVSCTAANTLPLILTGDCCQGWPSSLTVRPVVSLP